MIRIRSFPHCDFIASKKWFLKFILLFVSLYMNIELTYIAFFSEVAALNTDNKYVSIQGIWYIFFHDFLHSCMPEVSNKISCSFAM